MIRPITFICFLAASGSGLYLYHVKHRVQVLDHKIEQTARQADAMRAQTRMLSAEWMLLNAPERLQKLANQFLTLQPVSPSQYTSLADLDSRLPPVQLTPPPGSKPQPAPDAVPETGVPVAQAEPPAPDATPDQPVDTAGVVAVLPPPPPPPAPELPPAPSHPMVAQATPPETHSESRPHETGSADRRVREARIEPHRAEPRPQAPRPQDSRPQNSRPQARPEPRPAPARRVVVASEPPPRYVPRPAPPPAPSPRPSSTQRGGSMLGMAQGGNLPRPVPLPRPMPVNSYQSFRDGGG